MKIAIGIGIPLVDMRSSCREEEMPDCSRTKSENLRGGSDI